MRAMRNFNFFSLIVIAAAAALTWSTVSQASVPEKVHVLENLSPSELKEAYALIQAKGYVVSKKPLFSESKKALVITKTIRTESDEPSVQIELMKKENEHSLPRTTFKVQVPSERIQDALQQFPSSAQLIDTNVMPVAYQQD